MWGIVKHQHSLLVKCLFPWDRKIDLKDQLDYLKVLILQAREMRIEGL